MQTTPTAGFIAQELDEVQTKENAEWLNLVLKIIPDKLEATPGNLLPIIVKAIQELKTENDELKNEVITLRASIAERVKKESKSCSAQGSPAGRCTNKNLFERCKELSDHIGGFFMKLTLNKFLMTSVLYLFPFTVQSQSSIEFQPGTTIEVTTGQIFVPIISLLTAHIPAVDRMRRRFYSS